jgi:iron complex outermembrane recepter protein
MRSISGYVHSFSTLILLGAAFGCAGADAQTLVHFDLPAQPLAQSLKAIGAATNTDVGFSASQVARFIAPSLKADLTVDGALVRVLAGTGLRPKHLGDHTIVIAAAESASSISAEVRLLPAQASAPAAAGDQVMTPQAEAVPDATEKPSQSMARKDDLDEIVVTGTNIRGVTNTASPTQVYSRADIDSAGLSTVAEFIQQLPQNYNGGAADNTLFTGGGTAANNVAGSGVNLRGLGNDATLVLLNGHRSAPGNLNGNFVDISMIPLGAIEHIDIVTDGASAIYGSDAVGGVVNFILRRSFEGAEARVKYGSDGDTHDIEIGQSFGHNWGSGSALISYEYYDRTPLDGTTRSYTPISPLQTFDILPEQVRQSVFATLNQSVSSSIELFGDANFSHRSTNSIYGYPGTTLATSYIYTSEAAISAYSGTIGSRIAVFDKARLELSGIYGASDTRYPFYTGLGNSSPALTEDQKVKSRIASLDAKLDGPLAFLPAGEILFAVGGQYRRETFHSLNFLSPASTFNETRDVVAGFAELHIPLVGRNGSRSPPARVELSLAGRLERYSDFGSTGNPQAGLTWNVSEDLRFRGTYGKSFKAPNLSDLTPASDQVIPFPGMFFGGGPNTLEIVGGNPDLKPERAKTWTAGFDVHPSAIHGLKASATYYNIRFGNEIVAPNNLVNTGSLFTFESVLGPDILQLNPSSGQVASLAARPGFINPFGVQLSTIGAIFDSRSQNLSIVKTSGVDFGGSYRKETTPGTLEVGINATYILNFDNQVSATSPATSTLNTPYNPVDLKVRGHASYTRGLLTLNAFVNYINSYRDHRVIPVVSVASWTTVDATANYQLPFEFEPFKNSQLTLSVINIANRSPPFVANDAGLPVNYDGANANPLGRYLSLLVSKRW